MKSYQSFSRAAWTRRPNRIARKCGRGTFPPSPVSRSRPHRAFTLVELLVVITIIGILIALLLPAVQAAREAARRMQCANNFKQTALAVHNYEQQIGTFPPGGIVRIPGYDTPECGPWPASPPDPAHISGPGWGALVIPFMEQQNIWDQFDWNVYANKLVNVTAAKNVIDTYICPSDPGSKELVQFTNALGPAPAGYVAQTNIAGVGDTHDWTCDDIWPKHLSKINGIFGRRDGCPISAVSDGTSHTLMLAEVNGGGEGSNGGFPWISSCLIIDMLDGINGPTTIPGGGSYANTSGTVIWGMRLCGASSFHPGGCNVALGDASVQFIYEDIDQAVLEALTTRAGGEIIDGNAAF